MRYRRADVAGGTYFFTVNLADRKADLLTHHIDILREVMQQVKLVGWASYCQPNLQK